MECLMTSLLLIGGFARRNAAYTLGFSGSTELFLLGLALRYGLFWEVVVRRERVRREHEALRGNHLRGIFALRVVHLLEERVLRRLLRRDHVPSLQECDQDLGRRAQDLRAMLGTHLLDRVGVLLLPLHAPAHEGVEHCRAHRFLLLRRE